MTDIKQLYKKEIQAYVGYLRSEGYKETTTKSYALNLGIYLKWLSNQSISYRKATQGDIISFRNEKQAAAHMVCSVNQLLLSVEKFYDDLQVRGKVKINPAKDITAGKRTTKVFKGRIEYDRLLKLYDSFSPDSTDIVGIRIKVIYGLYVFQGITTSELSLLRIDDIDLKTGCIFISSARRSLERKLQIDSRQSYYLSLYIEKIHSQILETRGLFSDRLIVSMGKSTQIHNTLSQSLKCLKKRDVSIESWKQIRGSVICHWLEENTDIFEVKRMAGHRYVDSTEVYLKSIVDKELQVELDLLFPII